MMGQTLKGRIMDTFESGPLPGCNISFADKGIGVTHAKGQFELVLVNDAHTVEFRFIGNSKMRFINRGESTDLGDVYMFWSPQMFICGPNKRGTVIDKYEDGGIKSIVPYNKRGINGVCSQ